MALFTSAKLASPRSCHIKLGEDSFRPGFGFILSDQRDDFGHQ
jgi:hypothetical protein